tara:strand:- start:44 stop:577 length:534 start_codon:yes stop_codon:yes gene_type:complete
MKTITLKLTKSEWTTLKEVHLCHPIFPNKDGLLDVDDVDKFREFLNDEIKAIPRPLNEPSRIDYDNLKSILSKLDKVTMKTITLTKSENALIHKISWDKEEIGIELDQSSEWLSHKVYDVDKFRKFLIDECGKCFKAIHLDESECPFPSQSKYYEGSVSQKHDNLKSILSKLDQEVK